MRRVVFAGLAMLACVAHANQAWRLSGSTSVAGILQARQAELEAKLGCKLEIVAPGSILGLASLVAGMADIAMVSGSVDETIARANEKQPGAVDRAGLHVASIGVSRLLPLVHPSNAVRKLTNSQLADIMSGKIANWRELGGADAGIEVISVSDSTAFVRQQLLRGAKMAPDALLVPTATQIPPLIAQRPHAIGIVSSGHARGKTSRVSLDDDMIVPLFLITKGSPTPEQERLIEMSRALLSD